MERILVSACLLGQPVRYDGRGNLVDHPIWQRWLGENRLLPLCPEVAGGLPTPRPPAELQGQTIAKVRVVTQSGEDVTEFFRRGAELAQQIARQHQVRMAILKANSPSCGNEHIYDGHFRGKKIPGQGMTAEHLSRAGVKVFNEHQLAEALEFLSGLEENS